MKNPKPILVTGSHRSGSTWVGRMIATSPKVAYIHEPFNLKHDIGICRARFDYWFTYVSKHNEQEYYGPINDTLNFRYNLADKLRSNKHPLHIVRQLKRYVLLSRHRWLHRRPLIKDPIALFSAEWLSSSFNMDTVVLIRHPAAFAGSLKVMNWIYPFSHFIKQPILIRDHLRIFEDEIRDYSTNEKDIIDQAGLLWKIIHYIILKYKKQHPDWIYIRHEDISLDPLSSFHSLFNSLGLDFTNQTSEAIKSSSLPHPPTSIQIADDLKRDSAANIYSWRDRLTAPEIERLKYNVQDVSREFYSDDEW